MHWTDPAQIEGNRNKKTEVITQTTFRSLVLLPMAALPDNYVSLQQLRERWLQRQREGQRTEADDRERNCEKRLGKTRQSAREREREENGADDIDDRRRSSNWSQNKDGGGSDGRCGKGAAAAAPEGFARDWRCVGREVGESSCSARAVVGDGVGKEVKGGDRRRPTSSDRGQRGFERSGSGLVSAKEDGAQGNGPRPSSRSMAGGRDGGGGSRKELDSPTLESKASDRPNPKRSEREVHYEARRTRIVPKEGGDSIESVCLFSAVAEESAGKQVKSEVFPEKRGHSGKKNRGKNKEAGVVGAEGVQRGGNWGRPHFRRNEGGHSGSRDRSLREEVASVVGIVPLGQHCPSSLNTEVTLGDDIPNAVPVRGLESPPDKELIESVCCASVVVEENSAKEMKSEEYEGKSDGGCGWRRCDKGRNKLGLLKGKEEEDRVDNLADDGHDTPAKATKEECKGNELRIREDLTRSNNPRRKGGKKNKHKAGRRREKEVQVDKPADGHDMPLDAVAMPGGKESLALEGTCLGINDSGNARGVFSGPRKNGLSCRERVVIGEDVKIREDFSEDKETFNKEVEPADMSNRTEGKLGRREGQNRRSSPLAETSRNWTKWNSKRESRDLASHLETDMIWVKKGDALGGGNTNYVTRAR
ncbi:hypothetical protein MLD38_002039 [Melastoma candidum]|uniref:Uncharacterized protein n=1 Tax=Melastoma candidum TaxID=119954 RepID=A0ACB9SEM0_9MYRT|nr:hypothetical protein MLD38_002039 [Melastoma candidum]